MAQTDAFDEHLTDAELHADEFIEPDTFGHEIAPRFGSRKLQLSQHFALDQSQLTSRSLRVRFGEGATAIEVTISHQPAEGMCSHLIDGVRKNCRRW